MEKSIYQLSNKDHNRLKTLLGREPKTLELVLAMALWNEHCSYRSSKKHLKKFQFSTQKQISALEEQAGIVDLGQGERVSFKMESHNHPSFLVPYHGASTGVGGILRDIFAMNARPLALADYLCFGQPLVQGHSERIDQVIKGIGDYGNSMGIPTTTGYTCFSSSYDGNILVNAMALGYLDSKTKAMDSKAKGIGNYIVYVGSATGRDGVLGASMASKSFNNNQEMAKPTVQIGDPFFGRQLMQACLKAMSEELIVSCQDMGAAGLTCSGFEMSDKGGLGLSLHLDQVPLRDQSLGPEEILLSESQERMLFVCEPEKWKKLKKLFEDYELNICILGEVLNQKEIELFWQGKQILKTDPSFWTSHAPLEDRPYKYPTPLARKDLKPQSPKHGCFKTNLLKILSSLEGRSRRFLYSQYDQRVGTNTVKDASYPITVLRLPESGRELGVAMGCRPYLMNLDVREGAKDSIFSPALQLALRGFKPWAVTDCLNFGNPEKEEIMGEFVSSVEHIAKACEILDTPIISGNVSFYNETNEKNIISTPAIAMMGLKENHKPLPSAGFKKAGERVYLLRSHQLYLEGAFKYFIEASPKEDQNMYGALQDPLVHLFLEKVFELSQIIPFSGARLVGKFGLAYTLARMILEHGIGFCLVKSFPFCLFQERLYEFVISINQEEEEAFKKIAKKSALDFTFMGESSTEKDFIFLNQKIPFQEMYDGYYKSWQEDICL